MLNPIKAFNDVNSTIQSVTGYSLSLSNIPKNLNKIAFPALALATGMYVAASESKGGSSIVPFVSSYENCIASCVRGSFKYNQDFFHELGKCVRVCVEYFPLS